MARARSTRAALSFEVRESQVQGLGAFATRRIREGARLIEYTGERISQEEADVRYDDDAMERHHTFLFAVDDDTVIDGAVDGNEARFINHSCEPNCEAVLEGKRVFIGAIRDIAPGEELLYDYGLERDEPYQEEWKELYVCKCGAASCRGTMLKSTVAKDAPASSKQRTKKGAAKKGKTSDRKRSRRASA